MRLWARLCWRRASVRALVVLASRRWRWPPRSRARSRRSSSRPGDTIRGVAERYLKDPDLWPQILELSGVGSPAELRPGAELMVPVQQVAAADEALAFSLAAIQKATAEGARIFAPGRDRQRHREPRHRGRAPRRRAPGPRSSATPASPPSSPTQALEISIAQRDRAAEAVVSDAQGERRGPRAGPAALVAAGAAGRAGRVRAGADAVGLDRAGDLPRPQPAAAEPELERDHPADAQRPADRRRGDQGQPGQRRLLRAPEPARRPHRLRGRGAGARDRRPSRPTSGSSTTARSRASPTTTRRRSRSPAAARRSASARTRARWCPPPAAPQSGPTVLARAELDAPFDGEQIYDAAVTLSWQPGRGRRGLLARGGGRRRLQRDAGLGVGRARHQPPPRGPGAGRALLAGLLARPARAARRAQPEPPLPPHRRRHAAVRDAARRRRRARS